MIYEVINPSDAVTIEADDLRVAQAATLLLGHGAFGLTDEQGEEAMPVMIFGGFDEWAEAQGFDLKGHFAPEKRGAVAACLATAMCCDVRERAAVRYMAADDAEALKRYNEAKRSSLNDICGRAHALAEHIAGLAAAAVDTLAAINEYGTETV